MEDRVDVSVDFAVLLSVSCKAGGTTWERFLHVPWSSPRPIQELLLA